MAGRTLIVRGGEAQVGGCAPCSVDCCPTIDLGCTSQGSCCKPNCCDPKDCYTFRARDAIPIGMAEAERLFYLQGRLPHHESSWVRRHLMIRLRRVDSCDWQWSMCALSINKENYVRFRWPDGFLRAPQGYYEGQLYIDEVPSGKMYFYKPVSRVDLDINMPVMYECKDPCDANWTKHCCTPPDIEPECPTPCEPTCGTACSCDGGCNDCCSR